VKIAIPETFRHALDGRLPADLHAAWYTNTRDVVDAARDADILLIGFIDGEEVRIAIDAARNARWISTHAAGVDHYPIQTIADRRQIFTNGSGVNAVPIAEYVVLCVLSAAKTFPLFVGYSQRHVWPAERPPATEVDGSHALVLGYGEIGRQIATRLRGLGVEVTAARRRPTPADDERITIIGADEWRDRLGEFDWILVAAALTPETRHMLSEAEFARMRSSAWMVNIARGGLVDQDALARALQAGQLAGAYLDVTDPEPLPTDHALWRIPNVFITGHSAGRSPRSQQRYISLFLENLRRFRAGEPLVNLVDFTSGY
jgi:phosphoglycerate dehydrogenase-like enzyme